MQYLCYTMQPGESLQSVAAKYRLSVSALVAANPQILTQPVLSSGMVIAIPVWNAQQPEFPTYPTAPIQPNPLPDLIPSPEPTPWPTPQPDPNTDERTHLEDEVVELTNSERLRRGLPALAFNRTLGGVARVKSEDMAANQYFSHVSPTYGTPFDMLQQFGFRYTAAGENIAQGQTTAQSVMNAWMQSAGHAANILSDAYTEIGVGYAYNNGLPIWTQLFIRP